MADKTKRKPFPLLTNLGRLWLEKAISKLIFASISLILLQIGIVVLSLPQLPPKVPLFYSLPWGESQLAPFPYLFLLPILSFSFLLLNTLLAVVFLEKKKFLSTCLTITSTLFSFFSLISLIEIILVVS